MSNAVAKHEASLCDISPLLDSHTNTIRYLAGTRIFDEGEPGDCAYLIDSGHVEISSSASGSKETLAILGPGEIFGEMAVIDGQPRCAAAMALHETTLISISRTQLLEEINRGGAITRLILIASMNRLRTWQNRNLRVADQDLDRDVPFWQNDAQLDLARHDASQQLKLRFDLERAIAQRQFELAYQPIVNLSDGRLSGFEALLRWPRPAGQVVMPDKFITLAEETGMIVPLGAWVLESALQAVVTIGRRIRPQPKCDTGIFISVNVSPCQLQREEDIERLAALIEHADVNPACVKLEITEQMLLADPRMALIALSRLKATGVSIAIDDFGTGYSSLNYLHRFPLDTLKIDRSFVSRIVEDPNRQRVVAAIIGLARELGMDVVAEGVEFQDEARWLRTAACHFAQGYLLAKPLPFNAALCHLDRNLEYF